MRLALGPTNFDLATRSLVIAVVDEADTLDLGRRAERLKADGADVLELRTHGLKALHDDDPGLLREVAACVAELVERFDLPVCVSTASAPILVAALVAGAVMACDASGFSHPDYLTAVARFGATVVVSQPGARLSADTAALCSLARRCEAAGIPSSHIVLDAGLGASLSSASVLGSLPRLTALGYPLLASLVSEGDDEGRSWDPEALATAALAMAGGCRLVRTSDVRSARRVVDTLAAVMEAQ